MPSSSRSPPLPPAPALPGASTTTPAPAVAQSELYSNWTLSRNYPALFPTDSNSKLTGQVNYLIWSTMFHQAAKTSECFGLLDGSILCPSSDRTKQQVWDLADGFLVSMTLKCISKDLIIKVQGKSAYNAWQVLGSEFSQSDAGSIMIWFHAMAEKLLKDGDIKVHTKRYEEAISKLALARFNFPPKYSAAFFVTSLYDHAADPLSYHKFVSSFTLTDTTTLQSTLISLSAFHCSNSMEKDSSTSSSTLDAAFATAQGVKYCRNKNCPKPQGHVIKDCWAPGGGNPGGGNRAGKHPGTNRRNKPKERAHITDEGGSTSQPSSTQSHFVASSIDTEYHSDISAYTSVLSESSVDHPPSESVLEESYRADTDSSRSPPIYVDTGTTSHIHSIMPILDEAKMYSVFGAGKCIVFHQDDNGKFMEELLDKLKIILTGTKDDSHLYSLDQLPLETVYYSASDADPPLWTKLY
ncbi:hypothetical protein J3R30DRAFT_3841761 [Lentinula aciculospora]|uniref:CCHC-type domain-containing protein n=1 Tax=Lentinula aciculospora TaxID=153920 RepID=A0A9W9DG76_9AGAR|nr:hypothetical protein J3R30DRAFT_3841761 [Lentinula aciculospora]